MPPATHYIQDLTSVEARLVEQSFEDELRVRAAEIQRGWAYYEGRHRAPLKPDSTGTDDNLIINLIEGIVDKSVSGLLGVDDTGMVRGLRFEVVAGPGDPGFVPRVIDAVRDAVGLAATHPSQAYLDAVWRANHASLLLVDALLSGAVAGHVFLKLLPDGTADDDGRPLPRIVSLNPASVSVFWDAADLGRVLWYRIQYGAAGHRVRQDIVRGPDPSGDGSGGWLIANFREGGAARWQPDGAPEVWPYPWPPLVDWKNLPNPNAYYGKSDIGGKGRLNDGLNLTASNVQRILKHHAHPKTVGTGVSAAGIEATSVDGLWTVASPEARLYNLEMQSDLSSSLNFILLLWRTIFDLARELNPGTVADRVGAITNFGLRVLFADSLAKGGVKRLLAGEGLRRLCRHLLELGGYDPALAVNVTWPEPLPTDPLQTAQALEIMAALGLSQQTALERAGFDPAQEAARRTAATAEQRSSGKP